MIVADRARRPSQGVLDFGEWSLDLEPIKERLADLQQPDDHPIRALFEVADLAALVAEVERLRGQVNAVKKTVRSPGITTVKGSPADRIMRILEVGE